MGCKFVAMLCFGVAVFCLFFNFENSKRLNTLMIYTFPINSNSDFKRMYYRARFKSGFFTVIYLKKNLATSAKLGVTVSKKVGKAVVRNRVRRIIMAAYRKLEQIENLRGFSIVIVAKYSCSSAKMLDVFKEIKKNIAFLKYDGCSFKSKKIYGKVR